MSKHFLEWSVPEHLRLVGIVIIWCSSPLQSALRVQRFGGPTTPQVDARYETAWEVRGPPNSMLWSKKGSQV